VCSREVAGDAMRRLASVDRNGLQFSGRVGVGGSDYYSGGRQQRRRAYRTRAPRYRALDVPASPASPPAHLPPVIQLRTLPPAAFPPTSLDPRAAPGDPPGVRPTSSSGSAARHPILQSSAVLALLVVASLSLVVGAIYLLIYFKSIKPMSARSRSYMQAAAAGAAVGGAGGGGKMADDDGGRARSTHPFFRRS